jgi:tetratricopeptide (TPR) repeat protein
MLAMVVGDAGAIAYRAGVDAIGTGDWTAASRWFERAVALDPWHPAGAKALVVAADAAGDAPLALEAARRAVELYPGDGASWANLAILCLRDGDAGCAAAAAQRATDAATLFGREAINAALVFEDVGDDAAADDAYRLSLLTNRITSLATTWPRPVTVSAPPGFELDPAALELNLVLAGIEVGRPLDPASVSDPAVRALAAALTGDRPAAESALDEAMERQPASLGTWEVALVLRDHWGEATGDVRRIYAAVLGSPPPSPDGRPGLRGLDYDIASFRIFPLDGFLRGAEHFVLPRPWPWILRELLP